MNLPSKELKRISRENLTFHYSIPMGAFAASGLLASLLEAPFASLQTEYASMTQTVIFYIAEFIISVLATVLSFGEYRIHLNMARKQEYRLGDLFFAFQNRTDHYLLVALFLFLIEIGPMIPCVICSTYAISNPSVTSVMLSLGAGLIGLIVFVLLQIEFHLLYFVIIDHSEMSFRDALRVTRGILKGYRGRLFYVFCSFVGMLLLGILSMGIGLLWIIPYQKQTLANLYLDIIGEIPVPQAQHIFDQTV